MLTIRYGLTFDDVLLIPQRTSLTSRRQAQLETLCTQNIHLPTPLLSANMASVTEAEMAIAMAQNGGLGIIHRFYSEEEQLQQVQRVKSQTATEQTSTCDPHGQLRAGAAIGVRNRMSRASNLVKAGADCLVFDVAHAHADHVIKHLKTLKQTLPDVDILVGNIATSSAAEDLIAAGADGLKVGIGPSPVCSTRQNTGCGVPQLTAIYDVATVAKEHDIPVCADGGIRTAGDIVKAIAVGASCIMNGSLFAGAHESPGDIIWKDGCPYAQYYGSASTVNKQRPAQSASDQQNRSQLEFIEGIATEVPYRGPASVLIQELCEGIQSGMSYCGAGTIAEMPNVAECIQITTNGVAESQTKEPS